jgi:hypothetical protein
MKKMMISLILLTVFCESKGQTPTNDPHWWLVKNEEFNSTNLWPFWEIENNRYHGGEDSIEAQIYINSNVTVSNSKLIITTKRENYINQG